MKIILDRTCPKCHGTLEHEHDEDGDYASCINCGYQSPVFSAKQLAKLTAIGPYNRRKEITLCALSG